MIVLGILWIVLLAILIFGIGTLVGDILMIRYVCRISWRESVHCGWLYFVDRFKKNKYE